MTDLSPEAQAVLDAANSAYDDAATVAQGTAAVLRAAADQFREMYETDGYVQDPDELLDAIAHELEGAGAE